MQNEMSYECPVCKTLHDGDTLVDPCPYCDWIYDYSDRHEGEENENFGVNSVSLAEARRLFEKGLNQWGDPLPPKPQQ